MKDYRLAGVVAALLCMLLFLGSLGMRIWASGQASGITGPDHIAASHDRVYVHIRGMLHVFTAAGQLLDKKPIEPLVHDTSLIDLRALQDGRLLLVRQQPAGIHLCDTHNWRCREVGGAIASRITDQLKVVLDESTGTLYAADFRASQLWTSLLGGTDAMPLTAKRVVRRPNDIAMDTNGRLWIADSDNRRILAMVRNGDGEWVKAQAYTARNEFSREGHDWPMMLAADADGNFWVTQPTDRGGRGDVVVYHPDNGAVARIELPEDADPTDIVRVGADMLVTDMENLKIYRLDAASHVVGDFGDVAFREMMGAERHRKTRLRSMVDLSLYGMIGFGVAMILAAIWASPPGKRLTPRPVVAPLAAGGSTPSGLRDIHWLRRNPKTEQRIVWLRRGFYLMPLLIFASICLLYFMFIEIADGPNRQPEDIERTQRMEHEFATIAAMLGLLAIGLPLVGRTTLRNLSSRLGTDGRQLFVKLEEGRQLSLPPEQLVYSAKYIGYKDRLFVIQTAKGMPLYADGEIATFISPLLTRAKKLDIWDMLRYQLRHREPTLIANTALTVAAVAMIVVTRGWRHLW